MKKLALKLIEWYQQKISARTAPCCRFYPTCSHYTHQAIERYGCFVGCFLGGLRLLRCNPLFKGGYDPVPEHLFKRSKKKKEMFSEENDENSADL